MMTAIKVSVSAYLISSISAYLKSVRQETKTSAKCQ